MFQRFFPREMLLEWIQRQKNFPNESLKIFGVIIRIEGNGLS